MRAPVALFSKKENWTDSQILQQKAIEKTMFPALALFAVALFMSMALYISGAVGGDGVSKMAALACGGILGYWGYACFAVPETDEQESNRQAEWAENRYFAQHERIRVAAILLFWFGSAAFIAAMPWLMI